MNPVFRSIQLVGNHFSQQVSHSFSNHLKISARDLKIIAVAAIAFAAICGLIYAVIPSRWLGNYQHDEDLLPEAQKSQNILQYFQKLLWQLNPFSLKIPSFPIHLPPLPLDIPPLPVIKYADVFNQIETKTAKDIEYLKNTGSNCRFANISCPKKTHVHVSGESEDVYLHANHVNLENQQIIASQYPLQGRFNMFWSACSGVSLIVDLTNSDDLLKGLLEYYPKTDDPEKFGDFLITRQNNIAIESLKAHLCTYHVKEMNAAKYRFAQIAYDIPRLHYEGWPDHHGISEDDLDQIIAIVEFYQKAYPSKEVLFHCRAGAGRTGVVSVACALKRLIDEKKVNASNLMDHIQRLILEGRKQRGSEFVQNKDQFEALRKWAWRAMYRYQQAQPVEA